MKVKLEEDDKETLNNLVGLMYDIALLDSGFTLDNTKLFSEKIYNIVKLGLNIEDSDGTNNPEETPTSINENTLDTSEEMEQID